MGWAARCRVGLWERTQQEFRRKRLAHNLLPRLILHQLLRLGLALLLFPVRVSKYLWRAYATDQKNTTPI